ncbi:hypothetical protein F441_11342 [Phytophthora nicotianae CJ01A1]|uniref:Uncharacterized protein n=2 Tax=Phytophthora nicotianae TaxID=4792 RepID=W2WU06_PHYNI|nr:hypothetical protein F444_07471 [Phytophthora nicotianae P1976]ETP13653.1 hypothetical protein F441_11342 [Phytophthora nicotianae CJ01A1]
MKEVVPKATRTKTAGTLREKEYKKGKVLRSVVCRLNRMCADKRLVKEIKCTALAMKPIQMETWHLVNLHTLRSLKHDLPLPDYGKTFFDHCGLHTYVAHDRHKESFSLGQHSDLSYWSKSGRIARRRKYDRFLRVETGFATATSGQRWRDDSRTVSEAVEGIQETDCLEALQMRDVLTPDGEKWSEKWNPWPSNIKNNGLAFYIRLKWEFQSVVEARMEAVPNEKGVRAFSLFPVSTAFKTAHIVINGTTLAGFVSRIRERGEGNLMED